MNNLATNPNLPAWVVFLITMVCMWCILYFWGARLLGDFGQPKTKPFVRPVVAFLWLALLWLQGRVYRLMLYEHRAGPDRFLRLMWPVQIAILLVLLIRAARLVDRTRVR